MGIVPTVRVLVADTVEPFTFKELVTATEEPETLNEFVTATLEPEILIHSLPVGSNTAPILRIEIHPKKIPINNLV